MRIVIDGTAGCGKTTFLMGSSTVYKDEPHFKSISDLGYTVFSELIRGIIRERKSRGLEPFADLNDFFRTGVKRAISFYEQGNEDDINFYDRGLPYLKIMSERYGYKMPSDFFEKCQLYRYDDPIFVFCPILSHDMRFPKPNEDKGKGYTIEERLSQHKMVLELYRSLGYMVVEVPVFDDGNIELNNEKRLSLIREYISV